MASNQGSTSRAPEHSPEEWENIREHFTDLYYRQKKKLREVKEVLEKEGFSAT